MTRMRFATTLIATSIAPIVVRGVVGEKIGARRADGARPISKTRRSALAVVRRRSSALDEGRGVVRVLLLLLDRLLLLRCVLRLLLALLRWLMGHRSLLRIAGIRRSVTIGQHLSLGCRNSSFRREQSPLSACHATRVA